MLESLGFAQGQYFPWVLFLQYDQLAIWFKPNRSNQNKRTCLATEILLLRCHRHHGRHRCTIAPPCHITAPPRRRHATAAHNIYQFYHLFSNFESSKKVRESNLVFLERGQRYLYCEIYIKLIKHHDHSLLVNRACQNVTKIYFLTSCDLQ